MAKLPKTLQDKLAQRKENAALRQLPFADTGVDFSSNDYLGFARSEAIFDETHEFLKTRKISSNGATGSRLLSGNYALLTETENFLAQFHDSESALLFNSGYDANVGFFSCVPQRNDIVLYDELCHASIRDGLQLSRARSYKFVHNDFEDLERLIEKFKSADAAIYIATESVFSMDGDTPNLEELVDLAQKHGCFLVIDEAHALGVFGEKGEGLLQLQGIQQAFFARIVTFGKGLGCHGAAILGSEELKNYLVNFARSFIYTTALPPHSAASILTAYRHLEEKKSVRESLRDNISFFNQQKNLLSLKPLFVRSKSAIQSAIIPGNERVKTISGQLRDKGFDVKAILSPTVPEGQERLRICLHSFNSEAEISGFLENLQQLL